ncbi:CRISPR-associated protein Cas2 [Pasteurellaceae bacterium LFhippo2]|nr:CRISPR-associated protein Cas2 [Pasteurellaceae bacterium LFhippo2]
MRYLIGYDVSDDKRLQRIHRRMIKFATPLQYSVFLFEGSKKMLDDGLKNILQILHKNEDDLRIYPLPTGTKEEYLGKPQYPEGIVWMLN